MTPLYASYNHTREDSPRTPCPECKRVQDLVNTHIALMNLMSCLEIASALFYSSELSESYGWWSNSVGMVAPYWPPKWVVS